MKKLVYAIIVLSMALFLGQGVSQATPFTFGDHSKYWPSWGNGNDDNKERIGRPGFTGGGGIINNNGYLTEIYFDYEQGAVHAGDVFIDIGSDGFWDYVIVSDADTPDNTNQDPGWARGVYEVNATFSATKGVNDGYYLKSNLYYSTYDVGSYRENHPVTASGTAPLHLIDNSISFTHFDSNASHSGQVIFKKLNGIKIGNNNFTIGFQPTCANDVIYEHVPEPATVLIVGFGLLGLGLCSSRKMKKRG